MVETSIYRSKSHACKLLSGEIAIISIFACVFFVVSEMLFSGINFHLRVILILGLWLFCIFVCMAFYAFSASYALRIVFDEVNGNITVLETGLARRKKLQFGKFTRFTFIAFCNEMPQESVIRASTGEEFGAPLSEDDKEKIADNLNRFTASLK